MSNFLWLFETLRSMLESPITLITVAWAFGLGLWRGSWWMPAVVTLVAVIASALLLKGHWQRLGIDVKTQMLQASYLFAILTYSFFAIARLLMHLLHRIEPRPRFIGKDEERDL